MKHILQNIHVFTSCHYRGLNKVISVFSVQILMFQQYWNRFPNRVNMLTSCNLLYHIPWWCTCAYVPMEEPVFTGGDIIHQWIMSRRRISIRQTLFKHSLQRLRRSDHNSRNFTHVNINKIGVCSSQRSGHNFIWRRKECVPFHFFFNHLWIILQRGAVWKIFLQGKTPKFFRIFSA